MKISAIVRYASRLAKARGSEAASSEWSDHRQLANPLHRDGTLCKRAGDHHVLAHKRHHFGFVAHFIYFRVSVANEDGIPSDLHALQSALLASLELRALFQPQAASEIYPVSSAPPATETARKTPERTNRILFTLLRYILSQSTMRSPSRRAGAGLLLLLPLTGLAQQPSLLSVRLESRLTSFDTKAGQSFEATAIAPFHSEDRLLIPAGSVIHGSVRKARSVRVGLTRERALLDLDFDRYELPDGRSVPFGAQVFAVDNGREDVTRDGKIQGILAAGGTPALARGIWGTPSMNILHRPIAGLTGFSTRLWAEFGMGPACAAGLLAFRWIALRFPEPEIELPVGTELLLAVTSIPEHAPRFNPERLEPEATPLAEELAALDPAVDKTSGKPSGDVLNLAFTGTRDQMAQAFAAAGWSEADPLSRATFTKMYRAYVSMNGYAKAPVSRLEYDDREPDFVFEKSLNTVHRRHHVRVWQLPGQNVWLAAATHDIGVGFDPRFRMMTHKIDEDIDRERSKVTSDLQSARCARGVTTIARPAAGLDRSPTIVTDGDLWLIRLQDCSAPPAVLVAKAKKPGNRASRMLRRFTLETRHYVLRDNAYHWGFRAARAGAGYVRRTVFLKPVARSFQTRNVSPTKSSHSESIH